MLFVHLASLLVRSPGPVQPWHHPSHLLPSRCYLLLVKWMTRHANIFLISRSTSLGAISGAALVRADSGILRAPGIESPSPAALRSSPQTNSASSDGLKGS